MKPHQVVPPSCVIKTNVSTLFKVDVSVGAVPLGHLTEAGQVIVRAVPSAMNCSVMPYAVPVDGTLLNVIEVMLALSETEKMLPVEQSSAKAPAEIAGAVFVSFSPVAVIAPAAPPGAT